MTNLELITPLLAIGVLSAMFVYAHSRRWNLLGIASAIGLALWIVYLNALANAVPH